MCRGSWACKLGAHVVSSCVYTYGCGSVVKLSRKDPVRLLGTEVFCPDLSWPQPPWLSLSSKGQIWTLANSGKEGMLTQGKGSQEITVQPWGRVLVPPQGIHIAVSLSSIELKPNKWKMLAFFIPIPKKGNAKEFSNYCTFVLISHASKAILKILQARLP